MGPYRTRRRVNSLQVLSGHTGGQVKFGAAKPTIPIATTSASYSRFAWIAALAGFLFGFDTVVISGANLPTRELWQTGPLFHGLFIMSMALWGTVAGALLGSWPADRLGRRPTLLWIGVAYTLSALGSALATDPYVFSAFRFVGGLGVGVSSVAVPIYISEIAPPELRGRLGARYQFLLVLGILVAFLSNAGLEGVGGDDDWRWMLGVEALPAVVYTLAALGLPESPTWLSRGSRAAGAAEAAGLFSRASRRPLTLAFAIAAFNQLSGINFVLYYAPEILERAGLATAESLRSSVLIGATNLVFTYVGLYLIDRIGRRSLLYIGSVGYVITLAGVAYGYYAELSPAIIVTCLSAFIAAHAVGQGAVIWVFISEIFPDGLRAAGQSWGSGTHWVFAALITLVGPIVNDAFAANPWPIFAFFGACMVGQLLWVWRAMPETRGRSVAELAAALRA